MNTKKCICVESPIIPREELGHIPRCPLYTPTPPAEEEKFDDLKPFKHGQEGTHYICDVQKFQICCGCSGHICPEPPQEKEPETWEKELHQFLLKDNWARIFELFKSARTQAAQEAEARGREEAIEQALSFVGDNCKDLTNWHCGYRAAQNEIRSLLESLKKSV